MIERHDGWLFLSHSNKDFEQVRQIRNVLEEQGFHPITFFLKCLDDGAELEELLKREISARRWFVYVKSENSEASKWVKEERNYAESIGKTVYTVDVPEAGSKPNYLQQLELLLKRATVFMSYSQSDRDIAKVIREKLSANDFQVWVDEDLYFTPAWQYEMAKQIDNAGLCLLLISNRSVKSHHVRVESYRAYSEHRRVIAIMVGDVQLSHGLQDFVPFIPRFRVSETPTQEELDALIEYITKF